MLGINKGIAELISTIPDILELESQELLQHSLSVAYLSKLLASEIDCNCEIESFLAGLVHDIGSFDIAYKRIHQFDLYSDIADKKVLAHPLISAQIVSSISGLASLADIVIAHHERFDGRGYPLKRSYEKIPLEAQIVRIADSLNAKFNHSHRFDLDKAIYYLTEQGNKEFKADYLGPVKNVIGDKSTTQVLSNPFSLVKEVADMIESLKNTSAQLNNISIEEVLFFFSQLLDAKHSYSEGHSIRVSNYAILVALGLGLDMQAVETVRIAGLLHDLGKLGVPGNILDKPDTLTDEERVIIRQHPDFAVKITKKISSLEVFLPILQSDQEHWDGRGYPNGLKGEEIPLFARIILVADAFDAMTSDRAYRKAMPIYKAIKELESCSGNDFDPEVVKVACEIFKNLDIPKPPEEKSF